MGIDLHTKTIATRRCHRFPGQPTVPRSQTPPAVDLRNSRPIHVRLMRHNADMNGAPSGDPS